MDDSFAALAESFRSRGLRVVFADWYTSEKRNGKRFEVCFKYPELTVGKMWMATTNLCGAGGWMGVLGPFIPRR